MTTFTGTTAVTGNDAGADVLCVATIVLKSFDGGSQGGANLAISGPGMVLGPARVDDYLKRLPFEKGVARYVVGLDIAREITRFFSGFTSTLSSIMTIVIDVIKQIGQAVIEAAKYIKTTASGVSCFLYALTAIPKVIKAVNCFTILNKLEKSKEKVAELKKIYTKTPNELKVAAPEIYAKLEKDELIEQSHVDEAIKECKENGILSVVTVCLSLLAIVATVLVAVCTGGVGLIVGSVFGAVVLLTITAVDIKSWISALKEAKGLNDKELAINIVSIVIGIISLVVAVFFAPTLLLQVISGLLCVIPIAIPVFNLIYLKVKEDSYKNKQPVILS